MILSSPDITGIRYTSPERILYSRDQTLASDRKCCRRTPTITLRTLRTAFFTESNRFLCHKVAKPAQLTLGYCFLTCHLTAHKRTLTIPEELLWTSDLYPDSHR
ncbi:hypothetical protein CEXT_214631 [Caerostris extrusa]|uniref:Uncharacterized protein n=1 Tax=Caerostris extrusa TaxID=172846 RepID=A0AAV4PIE0_CAEEX|nr:hypothetical protein CEXT_214631 [Caerostris extrusa]